MTKFSRDWYGRVKIHNLLLVDGNESDATLTRLSSAAPGEYFAFDQRRREIVATLVRLASDPAHS
jgi:hypothetical protein